MVTLPEKNVYKMAQKSKPNESSLNRIKTSH